MSEPEEENPENQTFLSKSRDLITLHSIDKDLLMDIDFALDSSWPLDQISFASSPMSPFLFSSSEQPPSPLWVFSDVEDDKLAGNASSTPIAGGLRLSDCPRSPLLALNIDTPDPVNESAMENDNERRLAPVRTPLELDGSCMIKEKMSQALRYFKESTEQHVLAQVWVPVKNGDRYVLTTLGQPFILDPHSYGLRQYRMVSLMYMFSADGESDGELGLPGRVFQQKLPEWTPNVQYYSSREYPRRNHALHYNVRGSLALPVFEPSGQSCVGVLELIMTSEKINYAPEIDKVCKALEAVNLKSSKLLDHPKTSVCNEGRQKALVEILEILTLVCETHKLPLVQTWVPCRHCSILAYGGGMKKRCTSFDGSCMGQVCMSTSDVAFYVVDAHMWGFREACAEHHLRKGQGVAGRAFSSQNLCFCNDITQFSKTDYPLVHYARMFGLTSCFAICLRSTHTGNDEYVLEFFLPPSITDSRDQQTLLDSLLETMKQHFLSLKVASGKELEEKSIEIIKASTDEKLDSRLESIRISQSTQSPPEPDVLPHGGETVQLDSLGKQLMVESDAINDRGNVVSVGGSHNAVSFSENKNTKKIPKRKRGKAEKSISLEVLQPYFTGSLKDAAKSLGVCPTTMKRICRQHGISRWPSRKINKVNRSLSKLKHVIESVQGVTSLAKSPLPLAIGSNQQNAPGLKPSEPEGRNNESPTHKTQGSNGQAEMGDQMLGGRILSHDQLTNEQIRFLPEFVKGSNRSKTGSGSGEESSGTPTSHNSAGELNVSAAACSIPDAFVTTQPQKQFGGILVEDSGSSKDLRNLCPLAADAVVDERLSESSWTNSPCSDMDPEPHTMPHVTARQDTKTMTVKATYQEDIIRFRVPSTCGNVELKEEVAKRLKLEVSTFDIKYLDDDNEWVLIACDADLQECVDISRSSGSNMIRLSVHDITAKLGSSCESIRE